MILIYFVASLSQNIGFLIKICNSNNHPNPQNIGCSNEDLQSNNYPNPQNIGCSNEDLQFKQPPKSTKHWMF
jgi:hypothetical protein